MRSRRICTLLVVASGFVAIGCDRPAEQSREVHMRADESGLNDFTHRVEDYVKWRRHLAGPLGAIDDTKSPNEISAHEKMLGEAIRKERVNAKQGDIFSPRAAPILKARIKETYKSSLQPRDTRQDTEVEVTDFVPQVGMLYPTTLPLGRFPPTLLTVLPQLPKELEYRRVTHYLILRDVQANIIVDVLPNAIP